MTDTASATRTGKIAKTDAAWRAPVRAREWAEASRLHGKMRRSMVARCCGEPRMALPVLSVDVKTDFAAGWASFDTPAAAAAVREPEDCSPFMRRTEVRCARCHSHTVGLSYAASGVPLQFKPGGT